jgi:serine/threonine-protein kinase
MARVGLDPDGRLTSLLVVPEATTAPASAEPAEPDWAPLLRATGVDAKTLVPVTPERTPPVFADRRTAWTGSWPGIPEIPLRIEAAAAGGRPVSLSIVLPWTRAEEAPAPQETPGSRARQILSGLWPFVVVVGAGIPALQNVRRGRGDRRGALRLALYLGAARMSMFLAAHHAAAPFEARLFFSHLAFSMLGGGLAYVFYLAIEPYARRLWPRILVSWVRVLEGRFRDPLVGRDLLIGCAAGALLALPQRLAIWIPAMLGAASERPLWSQWSLEPLRGTVPALVTFAAIHAQGLFEIIFPMTTVLIFRLVLRRTGPALVAATLVATILSWPDGGSIPDYLVGILFWFTIAWLVLFRAGLLAFAAMFSVYAVIDQIPLTPHPSPWYLGTMLLSLAFIVAPALYGFWTSRAGRPLFHDEVLEPTARR